MFSQHQRVPSAAMGRSMHLWRFGHYGVPLVALPSAAGIAHEWEYNGLIESLRPLIEEGRLKLYCTESNVAESWTDDERHPAERVERHQSFERYVVDELVPWIRDDCRTPDIRIALAGTSLGAFYSANLALKHPETFFYALCMSGRYDTRWLTDGFTNEDIYYNNPMAFVPNLAGEALERVRRGVHLDLVCGQGRYEGSNGFATAAFAHVLRRQGISHRHEPWGPAASHEPIWWSRQVAHYLGQRFGQAHVNGAAAAPHEL
jgi:esterase/lipase superfamily enzyme